MRRRGGLISADDLRLYRARLQAPLLGDWRGHPVIAMPPPSSGGVTLIQLLNILEGFDLAALGLNSAATLHPMVEAMNLAYRDRNRWLGDPRFVAMPLKRLLSQGYADQLRRTIRPDGHRPAGELDPPPLAAPLKAPTPPTSR